MNRLGTLTMVAVLAVALAAQGMAGAPDGAAQTQGKSDTKSEGKAAAGTQEKSPTAKESPAGEAPSSAETGEKSPAAQATVTAEAQADAKARIEARKTMERIKERGAKTSSAARAKVESKLEAVATKTNEDAAVQGSAAIAGRLAAEFGMSASELIAEHRALGCSWGVLMIAHSLDANTAAAVTTAQLVELHSEGTGWGQIAAGLGLKLGHVVSAVQAEGRVAAGLAKP
ncbi:MAG: hypothetical protein ACRENJ_07150, partial [Candidatus Eiseniibacteriota bacterium]